VRATCPVCGTQSGDFPVVHATVRDASDTYAPNALQCSACNAVFLWPRMDAPEQHAFYDSNTQLLKAHGDEFDWDDYTRRTRADVSRRVEFLTPHLSTDQRLLEVGCGYGFFLSEIRSKVDTAIGLEPGAARQNFAKNELRLDVRSPPLSTAGIPPGSIDLACAFHVLEHIDRPIPFLTEIRDALRPGGLLVVEVPNFADLYVRLSAPYRAFHFQSAHLVYFTPETLRHVVEASGFTIESLIGVQRYAFANALHWLAKRRPQLKRPSRNAESVLCRAVDRLYRRCLESTRRSDTLICIARNAETAADTP
jgi:SAM-dependent methyltransferase